MIRDRLDPGLRAWIEFSNETWNWSFPQANHARDRAQARWGDGDRWQEWNAMRAAQMVQIFDRVFDGQHDRLVRVLATQTGWHGLEQQLTAPSWQAEDPANPRRPACSMPMPSPAISARLLGNDQKVEMTRDWLHATPPQAEEEGRAQGCAAIWPNLPAPARMTFCARGCWPNCATAASAATGATAWRHFLDHDMPYHRDVATDGGWSLWPTRPAPTWSASARRTG